MNETSRFHHHVGRALSFYEKHEHGISIVFFILGFVFDMFMLARIDSLETIGQQGLYLILIMAGLCQIFFEQGKPEPDTTQMFVLKRWFYEYRTAILHFLFGTLLNGYTLFFFKSSSLVISFGFMIVMIVLLVANESRRLKRSGLQFKFALLSLCFLCYFAYVIPVIAAAVNMLVFMLSMLIGCLPMVALGWWIQNYRPDHFERAKKQILIPMGIVVLVFLSLYMVKLIPPVPLSIQYIGVYHSVEKSGENYRLAHQRPWWKVWQNGDQDFIAQPGDKIHVFFRLFSPARFSDEVMMRWYWKDNKLGWTFQDAIPIRVVGGREEGFRGFGVKNNYQPGSWRVQIETADGREIGRVYFQLELTPTEVREFDYDEM